MKDVKNLPIILVVDDEPSALETFKTILEGQFSILTAETGKEALEKAAKEAVELVFLDIKMPDMDGMEILRRLKERDVNLSVVMATATDRAKVAVEAMQLGASDYITKPFDVDEVMAVARKEIERNNLLKELTCFRAQRDKDRFDNIVGESKNMEEIYKIIEKMARNEVTVIISGETGTGKELVARAIHFNSMRQNKPFIAINCASIPENLLESELFGHEKGAFTDATSQKLGMLELADEGTLFLDEISDLRLDMQAKLLRALEEREIKRVGGTRLIRLDVRIISATNVDLNKAVQEGRFRQDLYYRLNIVPIYITPLRDRREDIPLLVEHFLKIYNKAFRKKIECFADDAMQCFMDYNWPGNIRELKNIVERMVALSDPEAAVITVKDLPFDVFIKSSLLKCFQAKGMFKEACEDFQRQYIKAVLEKVGGNKVKAAKILGIHRNAVFNKMRSLGIDK